MTPSHPFIVNRQSSFLRMALLALVCAGASLRFWRLADISLVGDESYFWLWSQHLAWTYLDHPGGVAWLIGFSAWLGGGSEWGIRWLNALLGSLSILLAYGAARRLATPTAGLAAAAILAVAPPYVLTSRFVYTDTLPIFLLLCNLNLLLPILLGPRSPASVGAAVGIAPAGSVWRWLLIGGNWLLLLNTKLSVYPYFLGLAIGALAWRRDLLRQRRLWLAVALASLGFVPFLLWNVRHEWAGLAWMWQQFTQGTVRARGVLAIAHHILGYFTLWPLLLLAPGYLTARRMMIGRWLAIPSLLMVLPVALSPANSPRNLLVGLAPALALAGAWWTGEGQARRWRIGALLVALAAATLASIGTAHALLAPSALPQSSVAAAIREDAAGWRALGRRLASEEGLLFTVDYSVASQLWYYSGRPVYSSWGQYLLWGLPDFDEAVIVAQEYAPPARVDAELRQMFAEVSGPQRERLTEYGASKVIYLWEGRGRRVDKAEFARRLDFFALSASQ